MRSAAAAAHQTMPRLTSKSLPRAARPAVMIPLTFATVTGAVSFAHNFIIMPNVRQEAAQAAKDAGHASQAEVTALKEAQAERYAALMAQLQAMDSRLELRLGRIEEAVLGSPKR